MKGNQMKKKLLALASVLLVTGSSLAAPVDLVDVGASEINCLFSPTCTLLVSNTFSPLALPGTSGSGVLETRVFVGQPGSPDQDVYGYEYRVDLSGVVATNEPACFTNSIRWFTNRVEVKTNTITCRTNAVRVSNVLTCVTNILPGTNFTFCLTNAFPATNVIRCLTNAAGEITCFTNSFPGSNVITCLTNRIPTRTNIMCVTNRITGSNVVVCTTNWVRYFTNMVVCYTNVIPCPGTTPCIETLRIPFRSVYTNLNFGTGGVAAIQAYVVTNASLGTVAPVFAVREGGFIRLEFAPPVCPGQSSFFVGLFSTNPPTDVRAVAVLTSGSNAVVAARGPIGARRVIDCDLGPLSSAIASLSLRDIVAPNNNARAGRRGALQNLVEAAREAADAGQLGNLIEAVHAIAKKAGGEKNSWLTSAASRRLDPILDDLLACLRDASGNGEDNEGHDGDDHDDDDDDDDRDHGNGQGSNHGRGHRN
jgi:hypothetical protein